MSLKTLPIPPVPEETARVAHAAFPRGKVFMQVRDTLGTIYTDKDKLEASRGFYRVCLTQYAISLITSSTTWPGTL